MLGLFSRGKMKAGKASFLPAVLKGWLEVETERWCLFLDVSQDAAG